MKSILVRYGELTLKGNNKHMFISKLLDNIKYKLKKFDQSKIKFIKDNNSLVIDAEEEILEDVLEELKTVFGIYSLSVIEKCEKDLDKIAEKIIEIAKKSEYKRFKLEITRKDKSFPMTSADLKLALAPMVLKAVDNLIVDVHNPDLKIEVLVKKDGIQIFSKRIQGLKGLPVGVSGKGLSLLSGGIDSPVASFLTMKRGMHVDFIHFMTPPHTSPEALDKVFELAKIVSKYNSKKFNLYVCDFSMLLQELQHMPEESYKITIMRRMFMRIANKLAKQNGQEALITGESLGQVASQTIQSIDVINSTSELPILRPVLTYDKEEIILISKFIKSYETSILPFDDACSLFVPKQPVTKPKKWMAEQQENAILWNELLDYTMENKIQKFVFWNGSFTEEINKED
ncbi:thiamin biosynthesis protein [Mesoplasma florum L1]|uniref:Probable tRNA sulfurtransferase n=1 Tax=Mesoplasma florum (strain ATCC 33453 / NBRC 100688 / NCTC 11704 / L1) TaxID=265311 RepID=Q6F0N1_MESFL|nr:tRNA uracil 4-sulfurtransferase ThiI [Mesoplasma florum]AAT75942.1 thiamin biosynthesis protein [Mesoplasma florum L1]ATI73548.1 tRNA 4-thiouridine(8) synthase ThiI [Mesoplasma florum]ATI74238.1 tRNA 4-thiouridine(8) synthase ThiI [Mesoplasma florum]AVN59193.1 tRNA 4-thiouridine(8) synthase ThiI [Mesoplasma florum]AVN61244.1 tRNA 4-thiouridine(8) synthase ThiI [Mesoplasma florum]